MERDFPEPDWKVLRDLSRIALDRFCARVLADIAAIAADTSKTNHDRYGDIYGLIKDRDRALADAFDGPSRSKAFPQLLLMVNLELLTDEELSRFSQATRERLQAWTQE